MDNGGHSRKRDVESIYESDTNDRIQNNQSNLKNEEEEDVDDKWDDGNSIPDQEEMEDFDREDEEGVDEEEALSSVMPDSKPVEPSYEKFGSIEFGMLVKRLEDLWRAKVKKIKRKKPLTTLDMLKHIMPPTLMRECSRTNPGCPPESAFPLLRLLCPEKDGSRRAFAKEATLAKAYIDAFHWSKDKKEAKKLLNFHDPAMAGTDGVGDFSVILHHVLELDEPKLPRVSPEPSKVTLAQINQALDAFASLAGQKNKKTNHDWSKTSPGKTNKRKPVKIAELRAEWIRQFLNGGVLRITPLEHKWLARILVERMQFGIGFEKIMAWYHPLGPTMWSGHNSLKAVCDTLCQPQIANQISSPQNTNNNLSSTQDLSVAPYMTISAGAVQLGKPFSPMLSNRTSFQRIMTEISGRHRDYIKNQDFAQLTDARLRSTILGSLAMNHPVFAIETKLDGERMLVHYHREGGLVKIHSRQGVWFSDIYSPVLGPAIRRAIGHWDLDLILDGEVLAWDDAKKETIPFGNNRTVAKLRHDWMRSQGLLDGRDRDLHIGEDDVRKSTLNMVWNNSDDLVQDLAGKECWLQFVAFDVLYVGGPKARDFLASTISPYLNADPGSILGLDGLERKKILYRLVQQQATEVEIVFTRIIRPNGKACDGKSYFSFENPDTEYGHPSHVLDSITGVFHGHVPNLVEIDRARRGRLSDEEISQARAELVNEHYSNIVEHLFLEGLVFKDLATPYVLDKVSRVLSYWHKFKPDYFNSATASDLDLVVVGAYFATGLRHSGRPSSFLCACIDSNDENQFYPCCKVNGGSMDTHDLNSLLEKTGFKAAAADNPIDYGRWFRIDSLEAIPSFINTQSIVGDGKLWKPSKKDTPCLWIDPNDSVVVTLNAGEIIFSSAFPLGITLRFPRITHLRSDKAAGEIETDAQLWDIFNKVAAERAQNSNYASPLAGFGASKAKFGRFLTESQYRRHKKDNVKRPPKSLLSVKIASDPTTVKSKALAGLSFCVLDGNFVLDETGELGWDEAASFVKGKIDVEVFIKEHGGTVKLSPDEGTFVLGGQKSDSRVDAFIKGLESVQAELKPTKGKSTSLRAIKVQKMAEHKGVLRWTYPFSLVARWRSLALQGSIKSVHPDLIVPNILDYLAQPSSLSAADQLQHLGRLEDVSMMQRALELVEERAGSGMGLLVSDSSESAVNWYKKALAILEPEDSWILSRGLDCSSESSNTLFGVTKEVVFYFDIPQITKTAETGTKNVDASQERTVLDEDVLISVLPILRVCGASIVSHLSNDVTHVVCDLRPGIDRVSPNQLDQAIFRNPERGRKIMNWLDTRGTEQDIEIVSPSWVRASCQKLWES